MTAKKDETPAGPVRVVCVADNVWTLAGKLEEGDEGIVQPEELDALLDRVTVLE